VLRINDGDDDGKNDGDDGGNDDDSGYQDSGYGEKAYSKFFYGSKAVRYRLVSSSSLLSLNRRLHINSKQKHWNLYCLSECAFSLNILCTKKSHRLV